MVLSIAWQDLVAANLQLLDEAEDNGFVGVHNVKKVAAQAWELCDCPRDTEERDVVKRFLESLADEAQRDYEESSGFPAAPRRPEARDVGRWRAVERLRESDQQLRTDLDPFLADECRLLMYHGYWSAHVRLRHLHPELAVEHPAWREYAAST